MERRAGALDVDLISNRLGEMTVLPFNTRLPSSALTGLRAYNMP